MAVKDFILPPYFLLTILLTYDINRLLALKQRGHILDLGAVPSDSTKYTLHRIFLIYTL